jgi:2-oxoglutarate dehydrogenase E1 component
MTEQTIRDQFHSTSFLQGQNAEWVEQLHARDAPDPASVDASGGAFFRGLDDAAGDVQRRSSSACMALPIRFTNTCSRRRISPST